MLTNPFDDENDPYLILVNDEGQHSLWPAVVEAPAGWTVAHGPAERAACLDYVRANWTDIRPRSVTAHLATRTA